MAFTDNILAEMYTLETQNLMMISQVYLFAILMGWTNNTRTSGGRKYIWPSGQGTKAY